MDLTPVYDLRERLKTGAIAGTSLITEDFRLTRALEAFAPFEAASPVFAKLGQAVKNMLSPQCPNRAEALLDALSLCDAVLATQAITAVNAKVEPLIAATGSIFSNAPYSTLSPLLDALTTSGSGKYSIVIDTHDQNPQLFSDYRVKHGMVAALGAGYSELAEQVSIWLSKEGMEIIPLLKNGFDPNGKREMVRRVQVIEHVAGSLENDFYLSLLENSDKDVRGAAIYALRHTEDNGELLINLAKTEKGNPKKMAYWALSQLESPIVWDFWNIMFNKNPSAAAEYMTLASTSKSSVVIGRALLATLEPLRAPGSVMDKNSYNSLSTLMYALPGKSGPDICAYYEQAAAMGDTLDASKDDPKLLNLFRRGVTYYTSKSYLFSEFIPVVLTSSLIFHPTPDLVSLAETLHKKYGSLYTLPATAAAMITKSSSEAFQPVERLLNSGFRLMGINKEDKDALYSICWLLENLNWNKNETIPSLSLYFHNPTLGVDTKYSQKIAAPLDKRWYLDTMKYPDIFTSFLSRDNWPDDFETRKELTDFFFNLCRKKDDNREYVKVLARVGWTNYAGFFKKYCESQNSIDYWSVTSYLRELPVSIDEKISELEWLLGMLDAKKIKARATRAVSYLQDILKQYKEEQGQ